MDSRATVRVTYLRKTGARQRVSQALREQPQGTDTHENSCSVPALNRFLMVSSLELKSRVASPLYCPSGQLNILKLPILPRWGQTYREAAGQGLQRPIQGTENCTTDVSTAMRHASAIFAHCRCLQGRQNPE